MPTEHDYRDLAEEFDAQRTAVLEVGDQMQSLQSTPGVGGFFGAMFSFWCLQLGGQFGHVAEELRLAQLECLRRADVCAEYDSDLGRYESAMSYWRAETGGGTHQPHPPERPYPWVEGSR